MTWATEVAADSPSGWWRLNDSVGATTVVDSSGNGRNGTATAGATMPTFQTTGLVVSDANKAASFDTGDVINVASNAAWVSSTWTVEALVKSTAPLFSHDQGVIQSPMVGLWLGNANGRVSIQGYNVSPGVGINLNGGPVIANDSTAHHVAATLSGTTCTIYVDGTSVATGSFSGTPQTTTSALTIGQVQGGTSNGWPGVLDEIALYPTALSAARIAVHAAAALALPVSGTAALTQSSALTATGVRGKVGTAALTQASALFANAVGAVTASGTAALTQATALTATATVFTPVNVALGPWAADLSRSAGFALDVQIGLTVSEADDPAEALAIPRDTESEVYADPVLVDGRPT